MATSNTGSRRSRLRLFGGIGLVALLAAGFAAYWFVIRDTSAASVVSAEADAAREQAIADAAVADGDTEANAAADIEGGDSDTEAAQPDSGAAAGSSLDGVWAIDRTIGTFDSSCLTEVCGSSFVGFRIDEELVGFGAKTVVGRTPNVTGSIEVSGTQIIAGSFTVDMTTLITDNDQRTGALRGKNGALETDLFPEAIFVLTEPIELGELPPEGATVEVEAVGELTVHGVTNPVTIPLTAELQAGVMIVFGNLDNMLLADYDMPIPSAAVVLSVEDHATMELQLFFSR